MTLHMLSDEERQRLAALDALALLDSPREPQFDQLVRLVADVFDVPMVAISLVAESRQWFKASVGLNVCETSREVSFCTHTIGSDELMVVENAPDDARFVSNPLVTGEPGIRFYAGAPLRFGGQHRVGTLCVLDSRPRSFGPAERARLRMLADQCEALMSLHDKRRALTLEHARKEAALAGYKALFEDSATGIIRINSEGLIQEVNRFAQRMLGYRAVELIGCNVKRVIPMPWAAHHDEYLASFMRGTRPASIIGVGREVEALHRSGYVIPVHLAVSRVDLPEGAGTEFIGVLTDLTELTAARAAEHRERALLRSIIDASPEPIFARDMQGHYIVANAASLRFVGIDENEMHRFDLQTLLPAEVVTVIRQTDKAVLDDGQVRRLPLSLPGGRHFELTKAPLMSESGCVRGVVTVAHDVTELSAAKNAFEAQSELLGVLHDGLTDYQALISADQLWTFLQEALCRLTDSDYALIGEVVEQANKPALKIHAITDLSWNEQSQQLMQQLRSGDMMMTNPDTLLGRVFAGGEVVVVPDVAMDAGKRLFPPGHPPLFNYVGVPISNGSEVIGMLAFANCRRGVTEAVVDWLKPFTATCALLIQLYRGMAEREQVAEALRRAGEEQAAANRAKTEFLSAMSHELRTPLNAILGFAQLLQNSRREQLSDRQQGQVSQIEKSGRHLLALINEVLDLARIDSGKISLSIEPVDFSEVLRDALDTVQPLFMEQGITVVSEFDLPGCQILADRTRIRQVLINLLSNAIKYNVKGGRVRVQARLDGKNLNCRVEDSGRGIPADRLGELFQPFNRLGAENSAIEGTGVGLALTRKLLDHMGGCIGVESTEGVGSTFWFEIPLAPTGNIRPGFPCPAADDTRTTAQPRHSPRVKVLYVEDNPANRRLMEDLFEELPQLSLICAEDGRTGLKLAAAQAPRLVILDIDLPDMDGYEVKRRLELEPAMQGVPIMALSANAMPGDIRRGLDAGFIEYLTKPFDMNRLMDTIVCLVQRKPDSVGSDKNA